MLSAYFSEFGLIIGDSGQVWEVEDDGVRGPPLALLHSDGGHDAVVCVSAAMLFMELNLESKSPVLMRLVFSEIPESTFVHCKMGMAHVNNPCWGNMNAIFS